MGGAVGLWAGRSAFGGGPALVVPGRLDPVTAHARGLSPRRPPGFIEITGPATVRFADYPGNSMFNTLGNLHLDRRAGLLIPDFGAGDLLHLSGSASVDFEPAPDHRHPGARRIITVTASRVVRRAAALPFRYGEAEYSPFLP